ncbi:MAG: hypothetical protein OJI67_03260 [Prosthecobacter sp.]|nr:hypothetical protein [Prosthecobacter sp.]
MSALIQLHPHKSGDLWPGLSPITIRQDGDPLDLTGATILMQFKRYVTDATPALALTNVGASPGIVIDAEPTSGSFRVLERVIAVTELPPGRYFWDIQITLAGKPVTYASGTWQITHDVSR